MRELVATLFGIGRLRPAPGTWGSLAGVALAWGLHLLGGFTLLFVATAGVTLVGVWAVGNAPRGREDPSEYVIDEVAGQWIALWPVSLGAELAGTGFTALWPGIVAAFLVFRILDIIKPGPVARADARGDAWGIMADDLIAGAIAAVIVVLLAALGHGVMWIRGG